MNPDQTFFQIAATLLPALLFGGAFAAALRPPVFRSTRSAEISALVVAAVVSFFVFAEVEALNGALVGRPNESTTWTVAIALIAATYMIAVLFLLPWWRAIPAHKVRLRVAVFTTAGFVLVGAGSVELMRTAVELTESERGLADTRRDLLESRSNLLQTQSALITQSVVDIRRELRRIRALLRQQQRR